MANTEQRLSHLYSELLCLVTARHYTSVVVRQHNNSPSGEVGAKNPLTRDKKVIAVGKGKHLYIVKK